MTAHTTRAQAAARGIAAALLAAAWALAPARAADDAIAPRFKDRNAFGRFVAEGRDSPFGLDYVFVHNPGARDRELVDGVCGAVAFRWVNFADVNWGKIEKRPPRDGRHAYDWTDLDGAVAAWQRNGVNAMMSLRFHSPWAMAPKTDKEFVYLKGLPKQVALAASDYLPKPEHWQDFRRYVSALVERYDGDGKDDMPGLLFPVLHYQVGNEYYNEVFWAGTAEEYGQILREFARAARAACPDVQIILSGIGFEEVYGYYGAEMDARTAAYVRENLAKVPANMKPFLRRAEAFSRTTIGYGDAYDILDARWPNYGIVAKSKELLREAGFADKPVWSAEIYSGFPLMEPLVLPNWTLHAWPTPSKSLDYVKVLKNKDDSKFEEINAWYRALHAAQVVKICMVALDAGSQKLMMGWAVDAQHPLAVSTFSHHGLYSITLKQLWPAAYTYGLTIDKLEGLARVRRLKTPEHVYVYECSRKDGGRVLVAFCDDHVAQNYGEPTARMPAAVPVEARRARVTQIVTRIGQTRPESAVRPVERGLLRLELTEYPVFIEAAEDGG